MYRKTIFTLIDQKKELKEKRKDKLFEKLEKLYNLIKKYKNLVVRENDSYLDGKRFKELEEKILKGKTKKQIAEGNF